MAVHLYGVVRSGTPLPSHPGRQGAGVRTVADDGLAVLVSDVDEHARVGAADLLTHARVLEEVAVESTVLPMRFGVLLPDDESVRREVLERDRERIAGQVDRLDGHVQLSVRVHQEEEPALREVLRRDPALRELRDRVRETSPPMPSGSQLQLGKHVSLALQELAADYAAAIAPPLQACAERVQLVETAETQEVLNGAYLVRRERQRELDACVARLRQEYGDRLVFRYVGPQPPYSFVDA